MPSLYNSFFLKILAEIVIYFTFLCLAPREFYLEEHDMEIITIAGSNPFFGVKNTGVAKARVRKRIFDGWSGKQKRLALLVLSETNI